MARKSTPHGPRTRYMIAILASGKNKLITEEFEYKKEDALNASAEDAAAKFQEKHNMEPTIVLGPYGKPSNASEDKRDTVTVSADDIRHTSNNWTGKYQGWHVVANGLRAFSDYADDDLVILHFKARIDPADKTPKPKFHTNTAVPRDLVEDLQKSV